jgi:hypothetical protein
MATQRTRMASRPTMPKAAVKIRSRYLFANEENGPMQPPFCAATSELIQVLSWTKGGAVELKYPQQLN